MLARPKAKSGHSNLRWTRTTTTALFKANNSTRSMEGLGSVIHMTRECLLEFVPSNLPSFPVCIPVIPSGFLACRLVLVVLQAQNLLGFCKRFTSTVACSHSTPVTSPSPYSSPFKFFYLLFTLSPLSYPVFIFLFFISPETD